MTAVLTCRAPRILEHLQRPAPLEVKLPDFLHGTKSRLLEQMLVPLQRSAEISDGYSRQSMRMDMAQTRTE